MMYHFKHLPKLASLLVLFSLVFDCDSVSAQQSKLVNDPVDISGDFRDFSNTLFFADSLASFDPATGVGKIKWKRHEAFAAHNFDNSMLSYKRSYSNEFPSIEYAQDPVLPFSVEFTSPRTVRIRANTGAQGPSSEMSLMLVKEPVKDGSWKYKKINGGHEYTNAHGSVTIYENPWKILIKDSNGKVLTQTRGQADGKSSYTPTLPFSFVRRAADYSRSVAAVFSISPDEKIFGCGESFTRLDKNGQKVVLWTHDPNGVQTQTMYKPIPFYMSSRGYGIFMHTTSPITCDFGATYGESNAMQIGDENLDLFVFLGQPKDILDEYTNLTGKASMPPLWSFGLWMSRITYFSEQDGRNVAAKLRENRIPSDVIHFDTGWFETDWRCDYNFAPSRFKNPEGMIADLKKQGFRTSLWQLPYFVPKNTLYPEIVDKGLAVKNANGTIPYEDAVLDFSNPNTIKWYEDKISGLLKLGVGAIKVDFGEAAPLSGVYASGRTGFYEHNLYPLRYNKIVSELTKKITGDNIIWARSTWAGSQRYPIHWGGDAETTDKGMEAQLRGGLSLGLSGFTFWSHDIGGFTMKTPEDLYRRWLMMGLLSSHTRTHGQAPKEPWEYGKDFQDYFRKAVELKYKLMPYIYTQSKIASEKGLPMVRALLVEFPDDPGAWMVDNEYMLGSDMLIAPFFEKAKSRQVYLPKGKWVDYQSRKVYEGGWHDIEAGELEVVMLVREGAVLPHAKVAQSTDQIDWKNIELVGFNVESPRTTMKLFMPGESVVKDVLVIKKGGKLVLQYANR
ncbi:glycoside hydrolase family 31 protein [Dyadobacter chenhuakuii]|uniref:Alpha-xylosidase n=1 Tax=Dyadobacter chenhuakuii TaxID=2909339 RepID=A0ABY4XS60_9BACT|nr:alpha-xylosidase [Dyadobacter chenhuakuii]MCF2492419.1 alpha-xylosidase [Dyadobacter chenhuakuii]USJ33279.1 alpha-xylosidase [Dyadobacter chenhuakuii]